MTAQTWLLLLPLVLPFAGVPLALLLRRNQRVQSAFAVAWMFVTLGFTVALLYTVLSTRQPLVFQMGMWQAPYGITLTADPLNVFMLLMAGASSSTSTPSA